MDDPSPQGTTQCPQAAPSHADLTRVFGRIGLLSFGGPAAQIALMHRELVEERPWLTERQYLSALSFCMLLPGPEAMQLATYAGWKLRGIAGGLLAGLLFVLPGALLIALLALGYAAYGTRPEVAALFLGIKATVIVIVVQAMVRLSKKALHGRLAYGLAAASFVAIFALGLPFPLIILGAGLLGYALYDGVGAVPAPPATPVQPPWRTGLIWLALWLAPLAVLAPRGGFLFDLAAFFAQLGVVTFGGAYAVLAYMTQTVVQDQGWLTAPQMVDALGLAETTPGPLILVTQFVGMVAGQQQGGLGLALIAGALTLWMTFVPCFLWIFAGAPYVERITARPRLNAALGAITAAVVGVILNLSLWFALHVLFVDVSDATFGPVTLPLPDLASLQPIVLALIALAALLLMGLKRGVAATLLITAVAGYGLSLI